MLLRGWDPARHSNSILVVLAAVAIVASLGSAALPLDAEVASWTFGAAVVVGTVDSLRASTLDCLKWIDGGQEPVLEVVAELVTDIAEAATDSASGEARVDFDVVHSQLDAFAGNWGSHIATAQAGEVAAHTLVFPDRVIAAKLLKRVSSTEECCRWEGRVAASWRLLP